MKILVLLVSILFSQLLFGQNIKSLDSTQLIKLKPGTFNYLNLSVENELVLEGKEDVLLDFSSIDLPNKKIDSVTFLLSKESYKKRVTFESFSPYLLKDIDSSVNLKMFVFSQGDTLVFKSSGANNVSLKVDKRERPMFVSDTIVFGLLAIILALIFYTSHLQSKRWKKFYMFVPALLLCYLIPAILDSLGLISKEYSGLYTMAKNYLLPGALILMTLGIDFKGIINLGPKAIIMFLTATVGIIIGGPIAILIYSFIDPEVVGGIGNEAAWRGFSTLAGSWIGGGANQAAMLETYKYNPDFTEKWSQLILL